MTRSGHIRSGWPGVAWSVRAIRSRYRSLIIGLLGAGLLAGPAYALGPHEVILIANQGVADSVDLARYYARQRNIPPGNVLELSLPTPEADTLTPDEFNRLIRLPVERLCQERGIADHILAWVYSSHFPTRIATTPPLSLMGITFLRGRPADSNAVAQGSYASPLFAGPEHPAAPGFSGQTLESQREWQGVGMPLPSMMLGYAGPGGNTRAEIDAALARGLGADGSAPTGTLYLITNADVRTQCRLWEIEPTARELRRAGITVAITNDYPAHHAISGLMTGQADVPNAVLAQLQFLPGAMADNLTSFGGAFDTPIQTKLSHWIRAGATAASGTITEPYAIWTKFPHARLFTFSRAGCCTLECYYLALRCPLQQLIVGDPLCQPWAPRSTLSLLGMPSLPLTRTTEVQARVAAQGGEVYPRLLFLVDGKTAQPAGRSMAITLDPASLSSGRHVLRAIAYGAGTIRPQIFSELSFEVP